MFVQMEVFWWIFFSASASWFLQVLIYDQVSGSFLIYLDCDNAEALGVRIAPEIDGTSSRTHVYIECEIKNRPSVCSGQWCGNGGGQRLTAVPFAARTMKLTAKFRKERQTRPDSSALWNWRPSLEKRQTRPDLIAAAAQGWLSITIIIGSPSVTRGAWPGTVQRVPSWRSPFLLSPFPPSSSFSPVFFLFPRLLPFLLHAVCDNAGILLAR